MASHFRQHPGLACEECRRRKARCDRSRPCCGNCNEIGKQCVFNDQRAQRGPKKGQVKALRDRVNILERLLSEQQQIAESFTGTINPAVTAQLAKSPEVLSTETSPLWDLGASSETTPLWDMDTDFPMAIEHLLTTDMSEAPCQAGFTPSLTPESVRSGTQSGDEGQISALVRDDAVSVYFERVYSNIPILHKQRFFDMMDQKSPSKSQVCLQLAVQAVAAVSTAQMSKWGDSLYAETCAALETMEINGSVGGERGAPVELEYIQALLLLVYYEVLRMPQYRCIITSGRAFRLIQISRLHDIDAETVPIDNISGEDFARDEERRRTFWMAYCFDRFLSSRHQLPLTLHEEAARTRLPAPEASFQDSKPVRMGFLSEALSNPGTTILPAFAEEVILATLAGRTMSLRSISPSSTVDICARLQEIKDCLQKRMQIIAKHLPVTTAVVEPSLGFTHILACSIMISLNELAEGMAAAMNEYQKTMPNCLEQAFEACSEIERLARSSVRHGRFKTHVSLPALLSGAIKFLTNHRPHMQHDGVDELMSILQSLSCVNRQAEEFLHELGGVVGK